MPNGAPSYIMPEMSTVDDERFLPSGDEAGTAPSDRRFRPDIEGLRAVAIGLVLGVHCFAKGYPGGFIGVDVFFVISGFVITGLLLREATDSRGVGLLAFYARRARRILPAGLLVIVVTLILVRVLIGGSVVGVVAGDARQATVFLADFPHFDPIPTPLDSYWSLAVEEQFYLVYPAVFIVICAIGRRSSLRVRLGVFLSVVIASSFTWSVIDSPRQPFAAYYSPFTHAWEIAVGALLAVSTTQLKRIPPSCAAPMTWVGLVALVVLGKLIHLTPVGYPSWIGSLPVIAAVLVIAGGTPAPRFGAESVLRTAPFRWGGRLSYSIYLWNFPILVLIGQKWGPLTGTENVLICVGVVGLAALTYFAVENPVRHSAFLTRSPTASVVMGLLLIATTFALTFAF
jgi:peptidoglycan/LPS O-acetylase OafA/YrhL